MQVCALVSAGAVGLSTSNEGIQHPAAANSIFICLCLCLSFGRRLSPIGRLLTPLRPWWPSSAPCHWFPLGYIHRPPLVRCVVTRASGFVPTPPTRVVFLFAPAAFSFRLHQQPAATSNTKICQENLLVSVHCTLRSDRIILIKSRQMHTIYRGKGSFLPLILLQSTALNLSINLRKSRDENLWKSFLCNNSREREPVRKCQRSSESGPKEQPTDWFDGGNGGWRSVIISQPQRRQLLTVSFSPSSKVVDDNNHSVLGQHVRSI